MPYLVRSTAILLGLLLMGPAAHAQQVENILLTEGADPIWRGGPSSFAGFSFDQGNYNADTRRDLLIGAPGRNGTPGRVYVIFSGPTWTGQLNLESSASARISSVTAGDEFGFAMASGYIVKAEGSDPRDIAVAAPMADGGRGRVYLFSGQLSEGQQLTTADARFVVVGDVGDNIGVALATADLNNDGYRDLIIGTRTDRVYVVNGRADLSGTLYLPAAASAVLVAPGIGEVLEAADVTADGIHDLLVGAYRESRVYLLPGRANGYSGTVVLTAGVTRFTGIATRDHAGTSLRIADIDGDGVRDVVIGAPYATGPGNRVDAGAVYILWGGTGITTSRSLADAHVTIYGPSAGALTGIYLVAGHINRDHREDLVLSAPLGAGGAGELLVRYGSPRSGFGPADGSGRRFVDLADSSTIDRRIIGDAGIGPIRAAKVFELTGEGARDVLVGIPAANDRGGEIYAALSPRLQSSRRNFSFTLPEGAQGTDNALILNPSVISLSFAASSDASWLDVSPAAAVSSRDASAVLDLRASAQGLAPGTYSAKARVSSTTHHLVMFTDLNVTLNVVEARFAAITSPNTGTTPSQPFTVSGWAIDKGADSGTGVDRVEIWAYPAGGAGFHVATATYGGSRPDVAGIHGARYENSGFTAQISGLGGGTFKLVARARSTATGQTWEKAEVSVTIEAPPSPDDLDGDGLTDFLWQDSVEGWLAVWRLNNGRIIGGLPLSINREADLNWKIVGAGDFNRDGKRDFLWRHQGTGRLRVWYMNGGTVLGSADLSHSVADQQWRVAGVADFNGDGWPDILWHDQREGWLTIWRLEGVTLMGGLSLSERRVADTRWQVAAVRDLSGDGVPDILWHHRTEGWLAGWRLNGTQIVGGIPFSHNRVADTNWRIAGTGDMNNDGYADLIWRHTDGTLAIWALRNGQLLGGVPMSPNRLDPSWVLALPR